MDATAGAQVRLVRSRPAREADLAAKGAAGEPAIVGARYELSTQWVHRVG
ncbi:hypothetical protein [Streptomyces sp. 1268]